MDSIHVDKVTKAKKQAQRDSSLSPSQVVQKEREEEELNRAEILEAGQEDTKKGAKEVARQEEQKASQEVTSRMDTLNKLDMKKKYRLSYKVTLCEALVKLLRELDWPAFFGADVFSTSGEVISIKGKPFRTQEGILLVVTSPDGEVWHQGMLVTQEPPLDYAKLYDITLKVENTLDRKRGLIGKEDVNLVDAHGEPIRKEPSTTASQYPA